MLICRSKFGYEFLIKFPVLWILFFSTVSFAQNSDELLTLHQEGTSKATSSPEAAREMQTQVTSEIARAQILEILGEKRFLKNKSAIESRIVRQSAKFIPFVTHGIPVQGADGIWKMNVEIKLSKSSLRKMVVDAGFLHDSEGPASLLPMISYVDRRSGMSIRWWQGEIKDEMHKFLSGIRILFEDKFQTEFSKLGFHLIKPLGTSLSPLPEPFRGDRPAASDLIFIADYYLVPMILKGDVRFRESRETAGAATGVIKLEVVQASTGRSIAEVSRSFETDPGSYESLIRSKITSDLPEIAKDLATQVLEVWQRGTLNANLIRVGVRGTLSPKQVNEVKSGILQSVQEIKSLKERAFEFGYVLFEADYTGDIGLLTQRLKVLKLTSFDAKIVNSTDKAIEIEVKAR